MKGRGEAGQRRGRKDGESQLSGSTYIVPGGREARLPKGLTPEGSTLATIIPGTQLDHPIVFELLYCYPAMKRRHSPSLSCRMLGPDNSLSNEFESMGNSSLSREGIGEIIVVVRSPRWSSEGKASWMVERRVTRPPRGCNWILSQTRQLIRFYFSGLLSENPNSLISIF